MADQAPAFATPLESPVFQGVLGFVLVLASELLVAKLPVPRQITVAVLAIGVVFLASGVWHMLPRGVGDLTLDD